MTELLERLHALALQNTRRVFVDAAGTGLAIPNLVVAAVRGHGLVAYQCKADTDVTLAVAAMTVTAYAAEAVSLVSDTWHATTGTNPDTGEEWERGGMSDYVAAHGRDGTVQDSALVATFGRDLSIRADELPYEVKADGMWWGEQVTLTDEYVFDGRIANAVRGSYAEPTFRDLYGIDDPDTLVRVGTVALARYFGERVSPVPMTVSEP